ncbi:hypothetical protein C8Q80DRAFT_1328725 [Daedaleopsis nitida]|nr:hypothetical protein C8Q80DRAFT_1328725 [Daedaleopsis nitida]
MFHYYALATVCYAYLRDVPLSKDDDLADLFYIRRQRSFQQRSKWHNRGWTLQELVAPRHVLFLSQTWGVLGSKADFAISLEYITGVPEQVLRMEDNFANFSIAQRMSWAATRVTTRIEDEAYCLLGIFGINMPTLYGEGRNAFRR